jgi:hypothetical protein
MEQLLKLVRWGQVNPAARRAAKPLSDSVEARI